MTKSYFIYAIIINSCLASCLVKKVNVPADRNMFKTECSAFKF